jgi:hypothetical protein
MPPITGFVKVLYTKNKFGAKVAFGSCLVQRTISSRNGCESANLRSRFIALEIIYSSLIQTVQYSESGIPVPLGIPHDKSSYRAKQVHDLSIWNKIAAIFFSL